MSKVRVWTVGSEVVLTDVNRKDPRTAKITKVGRKFVYAGDYKFNAETGGSADSYGHQRMWHPSDYAVHVIAEKFTSSLRRMAEKRPRDAEGLGGLLAELNVLLLQASNELRRVSS